MVFSFELIKHANIRYRSSLGRLSRCELMAMLHALQIDCDVVEETIGGAPFLTFECRDLSPVELSWLARHSAVTLMAEKRPDGALFPLSVRRVRFLEEDCSELLKYKGKTGAVFTRMMINTAEALSDRNPLDPSPLTVADPLCGRGTALFCALEYGHHALGLDVDKKAVHEAGVYFRKYVEFHRLKLKMTSRSETFGKVSVPVSDFVFGPKKAGPGESDSRTLTLACGDTACLPALARRSMPDLLVADLPYGVQHAPQSGGGTESFSHLLHRALPCWFRSLSPGGVAALSFNTYTLKPETVKEELTEAGFTVIDTDPYGSLTHEVEQAVLRDVVFALKEKGGC